MIQRAFERAKAAITEARRTLHFLYVQRYGGFEVPERPVFDEASQDFFEQSLRECCFYLEYGSGGSTVMAARLGKSFITVESDKYFLAWVTKKIGMAVPGRWFIHADIGLTGLWSCPLIRLKTPKRLAAWKRYAESPWEEIQKIGVLPDLILIDGRFRAASALVCLKNLANSPNAVICVDDYAGRPHYRVIETFGRLASVRGRMAVFHPKPVAAEALDAAIEIYSRDWR